MIRNKKYDLYIGIDAGVSTGFAIWDPGVKKLLTVKSMTIHKAMHLVKENHKFSKGDIMVRIEDARLRTWIPAQANERAERGRAAGAGSVKRDCQIWEDFLKDNDIPYEMVAPKNNKTKVKAGYFQQLTKYEEDTNEHGRDAAMLVFAM